ncbi:MAG: L-aspartate oxidase [bacterium]
MILNVFPHMALHICVQGRSFYGSIISMNKKVKNQYDFIVIGSGIAGLCFALEVAKKGNVAVVTKKELMESNSNYAQGGIAAVLDKHDSFKQHIQDTLKAGCYLNDKKAVETMVKESPKAIQRLINLGAGFNRDDEQISLTKEGGHSRARIAHAKDATGREIERALIHNIRQNKNISSFESHIAVDLVVDKNRCVGVSVLDDENHKTEVFFAKAVVLATGGLGQVYFRNCNPKIATGDGLAMADRIGAQIKDMEFIQFHPTALNKSGQPTFLISETLRGEGGILKNYLGHAFMKKYHPDKDLAPRDVVSRVVFEELKDGPIYLDIKHLGSKYIKHRFPYIYDKLWWYGIKMDQDMIPVAPAAHYACGGVHTDLSGRTNIKGLYAIGEVAHTGVHGGNRLASNSLLECVVFSYRTAKAVIKDNANLKIKSKLNNGIFRMAGKVDPKILPIKNQIKKLMWKQVGIVRDEQKLLQTLNKLKKLEKDTEKLYNRGMSRQVIELRNLVRVAILITRAARKRKHSTCAHFLGN